ncbi:MAG: hypothetical protein WC044_09500 [Crocinitomicaceae bacterium]
MSQRTFFNKIFELKPDFALGKRRVRNAVIGGHLEVAEVVVAQRATQDHRQGR